MKIAVNYPHSEPVRVFQRGDDEIWFGRVRWRGRTVFTATSRQNPRADAILLCLEPPIVEPWAYDAGYRAGFRKVLAFHGGGDNVVPFRYPIPPLWPELPQHVNRRPWDKRKNAIVAVMGNKYPDRYEQAQTLAEWARASGLGFDLFGRPAFDLPCFRGELPGGAVEKRAKLAEYRYCWSPENQELPQYMTEKLPEACLAGCIPIFYSGADPSAYPFFPWEGVWLMNEPNQGPDLHADWLDTVEDHATAIRDEMSTDNLWEVVLREVKS